VNRTVRGLTFRVAAIEVLEQLEMVAIVAAAGCTRCWRAALAGARRRRGIFSGDDLIRRRSHGRPTAPSRDVRLPACPAGRRRLLPVPSTTSLSSFGTDQLCWLWRMSAVRVQARTFRSEAERLARVRDRCLIELHQRDPEAFRRWVMTARAADNPAPFFRRALDPGAV
jgi:hypothetical protein